jgi:two-component system, cell cycle sensor histidine kinase and response regulator CckA
VHVSDRVLSGALSAHRHRLLSPALFTLDGQGAIVSTNPSAEEFWQFEAHHLVGAPFASLFLFELGLASPDRFHLQWDLMLTAALYCGATFSARLPDAPPCEVQVRIEENRGTGGYFAVVEDLGTARQFEEPPVPGADSGLTLLADLGGVGFFDLNFKDEQIYYSPAWKRQLGFEDSELVNTYDTWLRLLHPDDSAAAPDQIARRHSQGVRNFSAEVRMQHRSGHYVWVHCLGVQVFAAGGQLERVAGLQIDVNERKEHEERLLITEDRFHRLTTEGALAAFDLDFVHRRHWFSPAWHRLLGVESDRPLEGVDPLLTALPPAVAGRGLPSFFLGTAPHEPTFVETVRLRSADGRSVPVIFSAHRELSRKGELLRVVGFCCPLPGSLARVTDQPIPHALIGDALDALSEALVVADQRGRVVYLNSNAHRLTGCPLETARTLKLTELLRLVRRSDNQPDEDALELALAGGVHPPLCDAHALLSCDGQSSRPIVWSIRQVWTPENTVAGLVLVFRDPQEMTLTPEELLKTNRLETLGVVAGGIAHDFNNLLTTILGGISQARENRDPSFLGDSERACLTAKALTRQLLAAAKGNVSRLTQAVAPVEILRDAARLARAGAAAEIVIEADEAMPAVSVDRAQMVQVFQNLVINALQALPAQGGRLALRARETVLGENEVSSLRAGRYVEFGISDNGSGIPPEHLEKIFEPFFTTKKQGTGLGLPTVRNIVVRHGGHIRVSSTVGQGTAFSILLPQTAKAPEPLEVRPAPMLRNGTGRVLLMDDDPDICRLAAGMLGSLDYKYDTVRNGDEAIALYKRSLKLRRPYDLVILDLTVVGGMGGEETFRQLQALDPDVRALVCTGYDSEDMARELIELGFRGYLSKPFRVGDLSRAIKKVLG